MQDIKQNLANAVREARTELGLSQEKLAEILNLDPVSYTHLDVYKRQVFTVYFVYFKLCGHFCKSKEICGKRDFRILSF